MRSSLSVVFGVLLVLGLVIPAVRASAAVPGYDSAYAGESAFLTLSRGETGTFTVFFMNTGSTTWARGTASQVDLAACRDDKVTCNAQDASEAPFRSGWLSATRYATHSQAAVGPGQIATFTYDVAVPATAAAGTYRFNGALVLSATGADIHNEGYYQDVTVPAGPAGGITVDPATDTNPTGTTHTVTITYRSPAGNPVANAPIDVFVVNDASPFTGTSCNLDPSASPSFTGPNACRIDATDPLTNASGQVQFSFTNSEAKTDRIIAWTAAAGTTYASNATALVQGSAKKTWIAAVARVDATPETSSRQFGALHTVAIALVDAGGAGVSLAGEAIRIEVHRSASTCDTANDAASGGTLVSATTRDTDATGKASFSYTGPSDPQPASSGNAVVDCILVYYDANRNNVLNTGELRDVVNVTWSDVAGTPTTLTASPASDSNPGSSTHTVTATLRDQFGTDVAGATVRFEVWRWTGSAYNRVQTATDTTNASGTATFAYTGPASSADDRILVCFERPNEASGTRNSCTNLSGTSGFTSAQATAQTTATQLGQTVTKLWASQATNQTDISAYTVVACVSGANRFFAATDTANSTTTRYFDYDSNDTFTVNGSTVTLSQFRSNCSAGDTFDAGSTYRTASGQTSVFKLLQ